MQLDVAVVSLCDMAKVREILISTHEGDIVFGQNSNVEYYYKRKWHIYGLVVLRRLLQNPSFV